MKVVIPFYEFLAQNADPLMVDSYTMSLDCDIPVLRKEALVASDCISVARFIAKYVSDFPEESEDKEEVLRALNSHPVFKIDPDLFERTWKTYQERKYN